MANFSTSTAPKTQQQTSDKQKLLQVALILIIIAIAGFGPTVLPHLTFWPYVGLSLLIGAAWSPIVFFFAVLLCQMAIDAYNLPTTGKYVLFIYAFFCICGCAFTAFLPLLLNAYTAVGFFAAFASICGFLIYNKDEPLPE